MDIHSIRCVGEPGGLDKLIMAALVAFMAVFTVSVAVNLMLL
jgi:hypothetical protein